MSCALHLATASLHADGWGNERALLFGSFLICITGGIAACTPATAMHPRPTTHSSAPDQPHGSARCCAARRHGILGLILRLPTVGDDVLRGWRRTSSPPAGSRSTPPRTPLGAWLHSTKRADPWGRSGVLEWGAGLGGRAAAGRAHAAMPPVRRICKSGSHHTEALSNPP